MIGQRDDIAGGGDGKHGKRGPWLGGGERAGWDLGGNRL
jgi:hypothetical protein